MGEKVERRRRKAEGGSEDGATEVDGGRTKSFRNSSKSSISSVQN